MTNWPNDPNRRADTLRFLPGEDEIYKAMVAVEKLSGDPRLTDAVNLLEAARAAVADYYDDVENRRKVTVIEGMVL